MPLTWKGEPLRLNMTGKPIPIWMGNADSPPVMLYNFDPNNTIFAGYTPNIAINAPNTQILPPNFGLTMDGTRTIYVNGINGAGPLQVTPGAAHPFQLANVTIVTNPAASPTEDASTPVPVQSALATQPSATTAAFSPPANTLLVAIVNVGIANINTTGNITITNTGTALSWSAPVIIENNSGGSGGANLISAIFIARNASAQAGITVTAHNSDASQQTQIGLALRVVNNANANQTGAATAQLANSQTNTCQINITPTKIGSLIYVAAEQNTTSAETAISGTTQIANQAISSGFGTMLYAKSTNNTTVLLSTAFGWTVVASPNTSIVALEIVP